MARFPVHMGQSLFLSQVSCLFPPLSQLYFVFRSSPLSSALLYFGVLEVLTTFIPQIYFNNLITTTQEAIASADVCLVCCCGQTPLCSHVNCHFPSKSLLPLFFTFDTFHHFALLSPLFLQVTYKFSHLTLLSSLHLFQVTSTILSLCIPHSGLNSFRFKSWFEFGLRRIAGNDSDAPFTD
jgi:hypothetical protein